MDGVKNTVEGATQSLSPKLGTSPFLAAAWLISGDCYWTLWKYWERRSEIRVHLPVDCVSCQRSMYKRSMLNNFLQFKRSHVNIFYLAAVPIISWVVFVSLVSKLRLQNTAFSLFRDSGLILFVAIRLLFLFLLTGGPQHQYINRFCWKINPSSCEVVLK